MNWTNADIMAHVADVCTGRSYAEAAELLSQEYSEYITSEQLRSAIRRDKDRNRHESGREGFSVPVSVSQTSSFVRPPKRSIQRKRVAQEVVFGAVGDTHLCSNYERNDILENLYDLYAEAGVRSVYHTGNYIDGEASFNQHEIHTHGVEGQCDYFLRTYPSREGITTLYCEGDDHEGWNRQKHGIITGQYLEDMARRRGRNDLSYLGFMEADVPLIEGSSRVVRVLHAGGGSSYALSHTSQKLIDSYEDYEKPDILLVGHYHKAHFLPMYRGVSVIQTGTTQEQTPFMKKKRLHADLGGWIVRVGISDDDEIVKLQAEFISYPALSWRK